MSTEHLLFDFLAQYMPLTEAEKKAITELNLFKTFKKGALLLQEGRHSLDAYFVVKGCLRVFYVINGEEKTTAFYTEMEGFTPHCVGSGQASEYNIACVEDSIIMVSNTAMETVMFEKFPRFETLCRILSEKVMHQMQASFDLFKTSSPEQRYRKLMEARPDLLHRVPQHQLASFLGITPPSLSRLRSRIAGKKGT